MFPPAVTANPRRRKTGIDVEAGIQPYWPETMVQPPAIRFCPPESVTHSRQTIPGATPMTRTFRLVPHAAGAYATVALASATSLRAETVFHADAAVPGRGNARAPV